MSSVVLDASAVLAVLRKERGAEVVAPVLTGAMISAVNYSEVLKKTVEVGGSMEMARLFLKQCELRIISFDLEQAFATAALYPHTSAKGLSLADRACLALGLTHHAKVLTAERRWSEISLDVEVVQIREPQC